MIAPFSHPLFTSMTGLGLGIARQSKSRAAAIVAPAAGFAAAVALHSLWNAGASAGLFFFVIYALIMLPALAVLLAIVAVSLKFEGRVIQAHLASEAATGLLTAAEYASLCSVRGRMHASAAAFRLGGPAAWRTRHAFHRAASELAFLRRRAAVDGVEPDRALERQYLRELGAGDAGRLTGGRPDPLCFVEAAARPPELHAKAEDPALRQAQGRPELRRRAGLHPAHWASAAARRGSCSCRRGCSPRPTGWRSS